MADSRKGAGTARPRKKSMEKRFSGDEPSPPLRNPFLESAVEFLWLLDVGIWNFAQEI
jgi:hypothetical protein